MTGDTGVSTGSLIGRRRSRRLVVALTTLAVLGAGLTATSPSPSSEATPGGGFTRIATLGAYENNSDPGADAVAEISTVTPDGNTLVYTDAAGDQVGFVDISDPSRPKPAGAVGVDGEPTSVYAVGAYLLVVVDSSDGNFAQPSGHISVLDASSRTVVRTIELNGQPDSIDVRGRTAVIAIENQRDEETTPPGGTKGDLPQSPAGRLAVLDLTGDVTAWTPETVSLTGLTKITEPTDPEPEYVKISPDGTRVAVTLQENNAVAVVDLESLTVTNSFSAGTVDVAGVDTVEDGVINPTGSLTDVPREPDSLGWIDNGRLATANEGDWRGGSRGWTIFDSETGEVVWDAGNTFENALIAAGHYPEDRSDAKGTEPEGLAVAEFGGRPYVFIGSERGNVVAAYDVTDPTQPRLTQLLPSTKGPEGLLPIPDRNLLVVSSEVDDVKIGLRATVQVYAFGDQPMAYPMISSKNRPDGSPIPWSALGALSADPRAPGQLWTATDAAFADTRILKINANRTPAMITSELPVTKDGQQASYDVEGLWAARDGFWLGVEGASGPDNLIVRTDLRGRVTDEILLPTEVSAELGKQGIEGITGSADGRTLTVALQRTAKGDPANTARIGRLDRQTGSWTWFLYPLSTTDVTGDWIGLSEIVTIDEDTVAVIERDKLSGPAAKIKRIMAVDLPSAAPGSVTRVDKKLLRDVVPDLRRTNGWTTEKLEGLTVDARGNWFAITDNDALKDNNGDTQFLRLGRLV